MAIFKQLVRFAMDGTPCYGDLIRTIDGIHHVRKLEGKSFDKLESTSKTFEVTKLLCPLESTPIMICIGLNYQSHAEEANLKVTKLPVVFTKPSDALAGPTDAISVHPDLQSHLDYEGELCVVIGKDCKDIAEENVLDYVLGYCVGNDITARKFQLPENSGGQFCYAKSFDAFAPIGPAIWSTHLVPDPQDITYRTLVNGQVVQETSTRDMMWTVRKLITHLSRATTLRKGTVIMTGTPAGVGHFRGGQYLKHDDVVEVEAIGLGRISNRIVLQ